MSWGGQPLSNNAALCPSVGPSAHPPANGDASLWIPSRLITAAASLILVQGLLSELRWAFFFELGNWFSQWGGFTCSLVIKIDLKVCITNSTPVQGAVNRPHLQLGVSSSSPCRGFYPRPLPHRPSVSTQIAADELVRRLRRFGGRGVGKGVLWKTHFRGTLLQGVEVAHFLFCFSLSPADPSLVRR